MFSAVLVARLRTWACTVVMGASAPAVLALTPDAATFPQVVVTASRVEQAQSQALVVVDVINRDQIDQSGASNLAEFLDTVAGVNLSRLYGRSGVDASLDIGYMGESGAQNVLVLVDGQRVNGLDQSSVLFSQIPLSSVRRIEIRKANGGALYGDRAQGGVVNIITRDDAAKEVGLSLGNFGTRKLDAYLGFQGDGLQGSVALMSASADGFRRQSASAQDTVHVKLSSRGAWGRLGFFARSFDEATEMPSYLSPAEFASNRRALGAYPTQSDRSGGSAGLRYDRFLPEGSVFSFDLTQRRSHDRTYSTIYNERLALTPEFRSTAGAWDWLLGLELSEASANTDAGKQVARGSDAIYAQASRLLGPDFTVEFSARTECARSEFQANATQAISSASARKSALSIAGRYEIGQNTTLRLGAFSGFRFPNADELYFFDQNTYDLLTINPMVTPMGTREMSAQMQRVFASGKVDVHYRNIRSSDEIGYQYDCGTVAGTAASCNTNLYDTSRQVLSLAARWLVGPSLAVNASLDLVQASIASGDNLGRRIPLTPARVARVSAAQKLGTFTLATTASYRGPMVQASDPSGFYPLIPARTVVDLGLTKKLSKTWALSAWLRNAFDKRYYDYAQYDGLYPADGRGFFLSLKAAL